jgi:hypothetical protein
MTDEQFQKLRTLILDQIVEIKALAVAVRSMERRLTSLEALAGGVIDPDVTFHAGTELEDLLKTRQSRGPRTDTE